MAEQLGDLTRTHTCGELRPTHVGADATLLGWVHRVRDLGGLLFIDVRDRAGVTQVVFDKDDEALIAKGKRLRSEFVVGVVGKVRLRSADTVNPKLPTGEVEIVVTRLAVLNEAKTPPFPVADETAVSEDVRLKYRYLDLRRPRLQANIILRHRLTTIIRRYFDENGFLEIETPILTKSTPEGARDYLVPSRVHPGEFFALPQSPQLFKQILMIAGMDRYVQICKCFRDEDLRADRQPEFTQVDVEMSFARPETIFGVIEPLMKQIFTVIGREITTPFRRMPYSEAVAVYGSDKPDLRPGMPIQDVRELFRESCSASSRRSSAKAALSERSSCQMRRATHGAPSTASSTRRRRKAATCCGRDGPTTARSRRRFPRPWAKKRSASCSMPPAQRMDNSPSWWPVSPTPSRRRSDNCG